MSHQDTDFEKVEEDLRRYFRAKEDEMELPSHLWERLAPNLDKQQRVRLLVPWHFEDLPLGHRKKLYVALVSAVAVMVIAGGLFLFRPSGSGSLGPEVAFAAAFDDLLNVESFHVVVDEYHSGGLTIETNFRYNLDLGMYESEDQLYDCGEWDGTYRYCTIRSKDSGEIVRAREEVGFHTLGEGDFLPPDTYHYWTNTEFDHALTTGERIIFSEFLAIDGKLYGRGRMGMTMDGFNNSGWEALPGVAAQGEMQTFLQRLFDQPAQDGIPLPSILDEYDSVERLDDVELNGVMAEHYRAERSLDQGGSDVVEIWLGKEDRLIRRVTRNRVYGPPDSSWIWNSTYTFSNFNEPVNIPTPWPCVGAESC